MTLDISMFNVDAFFCLPEVANKPYLTHQEEVRLYFCTLLGNLKLASIKPYLIRVDINTTNIISLAFHSIRLTHNLPF